MKLVIQVVSQARVSVEGKTSGEIEKGFLVLAGFGREDNTQVVDRMVKKMLGLRVFPDENGKTNLSLAAVQGKLLIVSQFTLYADCRHGNRPSFFAAGVEDASRALYEYLIERCRAQGTEVQTGIFGALMKVELTNAGPFTVILDSEELGYTPQ